jgi:predicted nicotinamide N-methyase
VLFLGECRENCDKKKMSFYFEEEENGLWESEYDLGCGVKVRIEENWNNEGSIGAVQWGNGVKLAQHLCTLKSMEIVRDFSQQRVIELGAGLGVVAIAAAKLGATVLATDLPIALPDIAANASVNDLDEEDENVFRCPESQGVLTVCPLGWGNDDDLNSKTVQSCLPATMVIAAACLYSFDAVDIFFDTIKKISNPKITKVILSGVIGEPPAIRFKQIWRDFFSCAVMLVDCNSQDIVAHIHNGNLKALDERHDQVKVLSDLDCEEAKGWELAILYLFLYE